MENFPNLLYCGLSKQLPTLIEDAKDYAYFKGLTIKAADLTDDSRILAPFSLFPSPFPKYWYEIVKELQPHLNYVILKVAHSKEFLLEALAGTIEVDEFVQNTFKIFQAVEKEKQLSLGLIRSDYMLNVDAHGKVSGIKQVENNTIASSFGGLSPIVADIHEYVLEKLSNTHLQYELLSNESNFKLAKALVSAFDIYDNCRAVVLFVVEDVTYNITDQRALEYAMRDYDKNLRVLRCSFKELRSCAELKGNTLFVKGEEVAVVYYRVGYVPEHYEPEDWETRLLIERSKAFKCPSAGLHLAGSKKVQLYLNKPGILERFVPDDIARKLREVFVGQYTLDNSENGYNVTSDAIQNPEKFVLKPERDGGGNNLYDDDLKNFLQNTQSSEKRDAFILMERINPPATLNCIVRRGVIPEMINVVGELGIYGAILGNDEVIHFNNTAGHLLRSKDIATTECGIVAGFGALDSPYLY